MHRPRSGRCLPTVEGWRPGFLLKCLCEAVEHALNVIGDNAIFKESIGREFLHSLGPVFGQSVYG